MKALNLTDGPVVATAEGHVLGGGEWGEVDDDLAEALVEAGKIVEADEPEAPAADVPPVAAEPPVTVDITPDDEPKEG